MRPSTVALEQTRGALVLLLEEQHEFYVRMKAWEVAYRYRLSAMLGRVQRFICQDNGAQYFTVLRASLLFGLSVHLGVVLRH